MPQTDPSLNRARIRRALLTWFRREKRDMPWRRTRDPYRIWVSEIMLQQTRVEQATPYYDRFVAAFPDVASLAAAPLSQVLKLWEGLGYYSRARHLHEAARRVVEHERGGLPGTAEGWAQLPGVGRYTAAAIASIAFGERVAVLDGNVKRVLARVCNIAEPVDQAATVNRLWAIAESLTPPSAPGDFNQGLMELGARVCVPRNPRCDLCPLRKDCMAHAAGVETERPVLVRKKAVPQVRQVVAVIWRRGRYLLAQRPPAGLLGGFWEFPAAEVKTGLRQKEVLCRFAERDLGVTIEPGLKLGVVRHDYSHFHSVLHVYLCEWTAGTPRSQRYAAVRWVGPKKMDGYPLHKAVHKVLALVECRGCSAATPCV